METEQVQDAPQIAVMPGAAEEVAKANNKAPAKEVKAPVVKAEQPVAKEEKQAKSDEWKPTDLDPDQQKLFNGVWKKLKTFERKDAEKEDLLRQQYEIIEQLRNTTGQVVNHIQNQDFNSVEAQLKHQRKEARERGDMDAFDDINDRLEEIRIKKLGMQHQPKQQQAQQPRISGAAEAARYAQSQNLIGAEDTTVISAWQDETDQYGETIRPWSKADDPRYMAALSEARAVFTNPNFSNKTIAERLEEVDRRMGVKTKKPQQEVMGAGNSGGNLTRRGANGNNRGVQMTPEAERIAVATKFAGPGKSRDEHIEAYKRQIQQIRGGR